MHFRYKSVSRPDGTSVRTPSVPISLIGQNESLDTIALIDSGADVSVIPREMGELLGLDLTGEFQYAFGVGGKVRTVERRIRLRISKDHESYTFEMPIKIIIDSYDMPPLLGRKGFFEHFEVTFDEIQEKVWLKRHKPRPEINRRH